MPHGNIWILPGLALVMGLVLALPLFSRRVEEELEAFLLVMGAAAVTISGQWTVPLLLEALTEPLKISLAVLAAGLLFKAASFRLGRWAAHLESRLGRRALLFLLVAGLALLSSLITAIIAALVLSEIASLMKLPRKTEIRLVVIACFAIGLGAALTPLGEPLAAIATAKLRFKPHEAGFFFLPVLLAPWVFPALLGLAVWAAFLKIPKKTLIPDLTSITPETGRGIVLRCARTYLFVASLVLLGRGITPLGEGFLARLPAKGLYWANMVSAILDNATLAAAEVTPAMGRETLRCLLMGLLLSGGMLIPGNIPNIICAKKLGITSREWAQTGVPLGLALMAACFVSLFFWGGIW